MDGDLKFQLETILGTKIFKTLPLSGGDISRAYSLETKTNKVFCKIHNSSKAFNMFTAERIGLEAISRSGVIKAPAVLKCNALKNGACLLMEYIEPKRPSDKDMQRFGHQLARLHLCTADEFGFAQDNWIGSLPQSNDRHKDWISFYIAARLLPQFKLAVSKRLLTQKEMPSVEVMQKILSGLFANNTPSLLHGDLWNGNYIISSDGEPYLVDPAVYYGHAEVDLAMTRLFGGFGASFYEAYQEILPRESDADPRQDLYQLYYLLVHLNLFGRSYYGAVSQILKKYFS